MRNNTGFIVSLLLVMSLTSIAGPVLPPAQATPPLKFAVKRQEMRGNYVQFKTIIDELGITEGMTILDIGSGPGAASFLFAEKLRGSGEVFATDIREDFVNYIAEEAKRRGLTNLFSAQVKEDGLDDFYGKHRYDLVFAANVYHCISNRIEYFGELRKLLKPDARLVLIIYNQVPLFSVDDLSGLDELVKSLSAETENSPFVQQLSGSTRQLLADGTDGEAIADALVDDFNRMLTDPDFYKNFYDGSYFRKNMFTAPERELANWLLMTIKENGALATPPDQIAARDMRAVIKLNRLFFKNRFGDHLANGGMGAYIPAGDANRHSSKYEMFRELNAAGFKFAEEITLSPYFDAIIMVPAAP